MSSFRYFPGESLREGAKAQAGDLRLCIAVAREALELYRGLGVRHITRLLPRTLHAEEVARRVVSMLQERLCFLPLPIRMVSALAIRVVTAQTRAFREIEAHQNFHRLGFG